MKKVYVGNSNIEGFGLFAKRDIKREEIVFIMKGRRIKMNESNKRKLLALPNIMGIDRGWWIDPAKPYVYANHSCNPNMGVKGKVTFVALRNIKKDEELTFDYSISEDTSWTMKCFCGSARCRGVVRGTRYLPEEYFKDYYPFFPTYFKKIYLKCHKNLIEAGFRW